MRKWQTTASFYGCKLYGGEQVEEQVSVTFETDQPFTEATSLLYQELAWAEVFKAKPEWQGDERVAGLIFLPKGDKWMMAPHVRLSHEYQEV
jgi:hypothetical protein